MTADLAAVAALYSRVVYDERLSARVSQFLRHHPHSLRPDGLAELSVVAAAVGKTEDQVMDVVLKSVKGTERRFQSVNHQEHGTWIRATRGHSRRLGVQFALLKMDPHVCLCCTPPVGAASAGPSPLQPPAEAVAAAIAAGPSPLQPPAEAVAAAIAAGPSPYQQPAGRSSSSAAAWLAPREGKGCGGKNRKGEAAEESRKDTEDRWLQVAVLSSSLDVYRQENAELRRSFADAVKEKEEMRTHIEHLEEAVSVMWAELFPDRLMPGASPDDDDQDSSYDWKSEDEQPAP